jgi:hypothetical protein
MIGGRPAASEVHGNEESLIILGIFESTRLQPISKHPVRSNSFEKP